MRLSKKIPPIKLTLKSISAPPPGIEDEQSLPVTSIWTRVEQQQSSIESQQPSHAMQQSQTPYVNEPLNLIQTSNCNATTNTTSTIVSSEPRPIIISNPRTISNSRFAITNNDGSASQFIPDMTFYEKLGQTAELEQFLRNGDLRVSVYGALNDVRNDVFPNMYLNAHQVQATRAINGILRPTLQRIIVSKISSSRNFMASFEFCAIGMYKFFADWYIRNHPWTETAPDRSWSQQLLEMATDLEQWIQSFENVLSNESLFGPLTYADIRKR